VRRVLALVGLSALTAPATAHPAGVPARAA
jgi:hypothetical protein